jgi:hypothetical protein
MAEGDQTQPFVYCPGKFFLPHQLPNHYFICKQRF